MHDTWERFLRSISNGYRNIPYHNLTHGLDVANVHKRFSAVTVSVPQRVLVQALS